MNIWQVIALAIGCVLVFWALGAYNRLIALRNTIGSAWSALDAHLQTRQRLLAAIVGRLRTLVPEQFAVLDAVLAASVQAAACADAVRPRPTAAARVASLALAEGVLASAVARLDSLVAAIPAQPQELRASRAELREVDAKLDFARQWFNQSVTVYNHAVRQFPTRLLTRLFRLRPAGRL